MIGIEVESEIKLPAGRVREAHRERMMDAATKGFAVSQERVPEDRGQLRQSMFAPEWRGDTLVYGATAPYAAPMEYGTDPGHTPPVQPLMEWAERIGKDPGFGAYVATEVIPEQGVTAHPYMRPSADAVESFLNTHDLSGYLE